MAATRLLSVISDSRNLPLKADILAASAQIELDRKFQSPPAARRVEIDRSYRASKRDVGNGEAAGCQMFIGSAFRCENRVDPS